MTAALRWIDDWARRFRWVAGLLIVFGVFASTMLLFDRRVPFEVLQVYPASAKPGDTVHITARVRRDLTQDCSVDMTRYLFAGDTRFDLGDAHASPEMIRDIERRSPGMLRVSILVPAAATPGPAEILSDLRYYCNRMHYLWPISVVTRLPFTVLPPS